MFRLCILFQNLRTQAHRQIYPHLTSRILYNGEPVPDLIRAGVVNYFFVYISSFFVLALLLGLAGLSVEESFSASATALGGVGPGFGPRIGPCCTFREISDAAKWLMAIGMLAGRLEILILVLPLTRTFWRG
jgi:trk system potassium uptake protein TrkH